nr:ABC transporter ATP-binding protein [uncultured Holophaga sp.]
MSHPLVQAIDLHHCYADGTEALRGVDFMLHSGECVALVGANGAGKSTLLQHLNGTLLPTSGSVRIGGLPVIRETLREIRRTVGMVFQDADDQLFTSSVREDVAFGPRNMGLPEADVEARVVQALEQTGISHLADRPPFRLSGGEKRRAALATVLSMGPDILVLDEPSAGLDPRARRQLIGLLRDFSLTRLIATHDLDLVLDLCARTLVMHEGQIRADGPTLEVFADQALLDACHLEKPFRMQGCPVCGRG